MVPKVSVISYALLVADPFLEGFLKCKWKRQLFQDLQVAMKRERDHLIDFSFWDKAILDKKVKTIIFHDSFI